MNKRGMKLLIRNTAIFEILLLVSFAFAFAFVLGANLGVVSGQNVGKVIPSSSLPPDTITRIVGSADFSSKDTGLGALNVRKGDIFLGGGETLKDAAVLDNVAGVRYKGSYAFKGNAVYKFDEGAVKWNEVAGANRNDILGEAGFTEADFNEFTTTDGSFESSGDVLQSADEKQLFAVGDDGELKAFSRSNVGDKWVAGGVGVSAGGGKETFSILGNQIATGGPAHLLKGLAFAGVAFAAVQLIGGLFGLGDQAKNSLSLAAFGGIMTWKGLKSLGDSGFGVLDKGNFLVKNAGLIGIGVGVAIFVLTYKKEKKRTVTFQCLPWEAPTGGGKCEECNKDEFRPCSEYRCRSLGQACQIVNAGTEEEKCVWVNPKDVTSPTISPWEDALSPDELNYVPDRTIRPPDRGVKIVRGSDRCLQAFTPLEFGVILNKPAACKLSWIRNDSYGEMPYYFDNIPYLLYNHTQKMKLPGPEEGVEGVSPILENDGTFSLFVRCQDANGNANVDAFVFNFCVDQSPDTTPPVIEGTSIGNRNPVQFGADEVPIEVYTNEPADCKWSRADKAYEDMENAMTCSSESFQVNADLSFTCSGDLTGIENNKENKFYFRCRDRPSALESERNVNTVSKELILRGSQPLNILAVTPEQNGTILGSTDTISVELGVMTDDGADEGKAICYFSPSGDDDSFVAMFETNSFEHRQELDLKSGNYDYYFRCIDAGGNSAESLTGFTVFVDTFAPEVSRVYKDGDALKVVTGENAGCVYSTQSCNYVFDEGLELLYSNPSIKNSHFVRWDSSVSYYVKCRDEQGNEPGPNDCSIVVNGVDF